MKIVKLISAVLTTLIMVACGGGGGGVAGGQGGGGNNAQTNNQILAQINQIFPFDPTAPREENFKCRYYNAPPPAQLSINEFFIELDSSSSTFNLHYTDASRNDYVTDIPGSFSFQNGALSLSITNFQTNFPPVLAFTESSIQLDTNMGMITHFTTQEFECYITGHEYNDPNQEFYSHYDCPDNNVQAATYDSNAFERDHINFPSTMVSSGSIFRQRDTYSIGLTNPTSIRRGYGIYRRVGDDVYLYFPIPEEQVFDDYYVLTGQIINNDNELVIDQLPMSSTCVRR